MIRFQNEWCEVHEADCREVAAGLEPGSFSLAVFDGPYGMGKAAWDRVKLDDLAEWYRPHFEDAGRLLGASASLYCWNTAAGWARLDPVLRGMGWEFGALVVWDKIQTAGAMALYTGSTRTWADTHEVAGHYWRGSPGGEPQTSSVLRVQPGGSPNNPDGMVRERIYSGRTRTSGMAKGTRIPLHPCQKPIAFAERIIHASSRPGERVWVPFGGTLREALAATRIGRADPTEARYVVTCELNQDGVDYLGPAIDQIRGDYDAKAAAGQVRLFGGKR